jgi:hypothetical protein
MQSFAQESSSKEPNESTAASACERSVDEYLAELKRMKDKKQNRTRNPMPTDVCILGWCKGVAKPTNHPPKETNPKDTQQTPDKQADPAAAPGESSSKRSAEEIGVPPETGAPAECDPLQAAQDVDVGDYYFSQKSYKPALNRYRLALENKPKDPAIYLRLARTFENLKDSDNAASNYRSVLEHSDPQSARAKEAQARLDRLAKK